MRTRHGNLSETQRALAMGQGDRMARGLHEVFSHKSDYFDHVVDDCRETGSADEA